MSKKILNIVWVFTAVFLAGASSLNRGERAAESQGDRAAGQSQSQSGKSSPGAGNSNDAPSEGAGPHYNWPDTDDDDTEVA